MFRLNMTSSSNLEGEMDGGVERLLDLDFRLAVAHAVVAHVKLDIPRVGELHIGLKHDHYVTSSMNCIASHPHINHLKVNLLQYLSNFPSIRLKSAGFHS